MSKKWLRKTFWRLTALAVVIAGVWVYLSYLTPTKLAVRQRLNEADAKSEKAIDARLKPMAKVFAKGRKGAKAFAEETISLKGKWQFVKGIVNGGESHRHYLSEAFGRHVFSSNELREAMQSSVRAYLDDIEGYESEMLVKLRADLADGPAGSLPTHIQGDEEFKREYKKLSALVVGELRLDMGVTVGREVGIVIAADVAANMALQAAKAAAAEMGISAGLLSTGVATLGVGIVLAFIIDAILDEVLKMAGYDPVAKIEKQVCETIDRMEQSLTRDSQFFSLLTKPGSLRKQMEELHETRSKLRRETIKRLMKEGK